AAPAPAEQPAAATPATADQPTAEPAPASGETVNLTMGSWRVDDVAQINAILDEFHKAYPNITIKFDPTNPPDYNATLRTQLEGGTGPDLYYLRSFATSRQLFEEGFIEPLADLPGLKESFSEASLVPWSAADGTPYGVPFIAVSHGIYYNKDLFKELGLSVPQTWEELLTTAQAIKDAGYIPFANASGDAWTIAEIVFMNLAPTFIGGYEGRQAYLNGERCFNDEAMVNAFQAVADLGPFVPDGQAALTYYDSQQLFLMGQAAMWLGGSWDIPVFESEAPDFEWGVFGIPAPEGQDQRYVTFHLDAGMGVNAASPNKEAAKTFLEWMATPEFAKLLANQLPGFFPISNNPPAPDNAHAAEFLALNEGAGLDIRLAWEKLLDGQPDGYTLMQDHAIAVLAGTETAQQAADALQEGLAQWFEPAQNCK
ncbi:MAG TPA: extracellular solute-binding protein, partial [Anaerolineae bacterium]|nr:extracellular solute-binding protein [Anaerolineae bacterium]